MAQGASRRFPKGMTLREAVAHAKAQMIAHGKRYRAMSREAQMLARQGRGGDTEIAHVALGELVVPQALQNSEVISAVGRAAAARDLPLSRLKVGGTNSINPNTGAPEFGILDGFSDWVSSRFGGNPSSSIPDAPSAARAADGYDFDNIPGAESMKSAMDAQASRAAQMPISADDIRACIGQARVLEGNPNLIGKPGGFSGDSIGKVPVVAGSAAVDPSQFGGKVSLRPYIGQISGTTAGGQSFDGISDTIGSSDVHNVREELKRRYPNMPILELVNGKDEGVTGVTIHMPRSLPCPPGTR